VLGAGTLGRSLDRMTGAIDVLQPDAPKRVVIVASNPAVSETTGWPIGFWWAELTHPYWELTERGYRVDVASPDGGRLEGDSWSNPRDESRYSADDLLSLGFINSPDHVRLRLGGGSNPFWIEDEARRIETSNFIVNGRFKPHAVRDGNLITGQQQFSGSVAARLIVEALGV
jgi:putative intracellular protease/amidase